MTAPQIPEDGAKRQSKPRGRKCQWCGERFETKHPSKLFCSDAHKNAFGNYMASRGKVLMPIALAWRTQRGRKGVGADALSAMVAFLDKCAAELHAQGAPAMAEHFRAVRASGAGITLAADRADHHRPSRKTARPEPEPTED